MPDAPVWDIEVDLVAVGSGAGGLTAAIAAHDGGQETLILEKSAQLGGVTAYSGGQTWCGANHLQEEAGIVDSPEAARAYLHYISGGEYLQENLDAFLANSRGVIEYLMTEAGVRFKAMRGFADYYFPDAPGSGGDGRMLEVEPFSGPSLGDWQHVTRISPHMPSGITFEEMFAWGGYGGMAGWDIDLYTQRIQDDMRTMGPGLAAYLVKAACVDRGIRTLTSTAATELITHGGAVVGVRASNGDGELAIHARKGIVLATSGYDGSPELAAKYERASEWNTAAFPGLTGDGLVMGAEIGGAVVSVPQDHGFPGIPAAPGETHDGAPLFRLPHLYMGLPHGIIVNSEGRRFADESFYPTLLAALQEFDGRNRRLKNFPCYLILDQDYRDNYMLGGVVPGQELPESFGATADTLAELAAELDIDPQGLEETVERFNGFARNGKDLDFKRGDFPWSNRNWGDVRVKPNPNLGTVERAPFYGVRMTIVGVGVNNTGLLTDANGGVRHVRGHSIPGLYAVGNTAAFVDCMRGYQSGYPNARGMVFGCLAARHAAEQPPREA
jgi:3-oxosteroid 1-dehydrogenase